MVGIARRYSDTRGMVRDHRAASTSRRKASSQGGAKAAVQAVSNEQIGAYSGLSSDATPLLPAAAERYGGDLQSELHRLSADAKVEFIRISSMRDNELKQRVFLDDFDCYYFRVPSTAGFGLLMFERGFIGGLFESLAAKFQKTRRGTGLRSWRDFTGLDDRILLIKSWLTSSFRKHAGSHQDFVWEQSSENQLAKSGWLLTYAIILESVNGLIHVFLPERDVDSPLKSPAASAVIKPNLDTATEDVRQLFAEAWRNLLDETNEFDTPSDLDVGGAIGKDRTGKQSTPNDDPRWDQLNEYHLNHPGESIKEFALQLFSEAPDPPPKQASAEQGIPPLPTKAPARWPRDRQGNENPAQFATRVYRVWMDADLVTRQFLKEIDPRLFSSLDNWLKYNKRKPIPEPLPEGFKILTIEQVNDAWVRLARAGQVEPPADSIEARRLANAMRRRESKSTQK
jgi:hypothetical protein